MADDKKNKPGSDSNPVDDGADDVEGATGSKRSARDQQDSLIGDEGWEDADNGDDDDEDEESDESDESDDESDEGDEDDDDEASDEDDEESEDDEDEDEDDEESEDDEDEDDDDEEETDDWLPDWAPWAVLGGLLLLGLAGGFGLLTPAKPGEAVQSAADVDVAPPPSSEPTTEPERPRPVPTARAEQGESIGASHLLVAYSGSKRSKPGVTRTKEEAKARAEEAMKKARKPGADFAKLVAEYSDEPGAAQRQGKLGSFTRNRMVKPFSDAAFELKVGEISDVVETDFGYHVILRTE